MLTQDGYSCECRAGYSGERCEYLVQELRRSATSSLCESFSGDGGGSPDAATSAPCVTDEFSSESVQGQANAAHVSL